MYSVCTVYVQCMYSDAYTIILVEVVVDAVFVAVDAVVVVVVVVGVRVRVRVYRAQI